MENHSGPTAYQCFFGPFSEQFQIPRILCNDQKKSHLAIRIWEFHTCYVDVSMHIWGLSGMMRSCCNCHMLLCIIVKLLIARCPFWGVFWFKDMKSTATNQHLQWQLPCLLDFMPCLMLQLGGCNLRATLYKHVSCKVHCGSEAMMWQELLGI